MQKYEKAATPDASLFSRAMCILPLAVLCRLMPQVEQAGGLKARATKTKGGIRRAQTSC